MKTTLYALAAVFLFASCDLGIPFDWGGDTPPPPSGDTSTGQYLIRLGEDTYVPPLGRRLRFVDVGEDSRCPIDVVCVWEGNAKILMRVSGGPAPDVDFELNTARTIGSNEFVLDDVRLVLLTVLPAPRSTESIPKAAYTVTIDVRQRRG
jgi:hypothetical protein